eukprot:4167411-Pleurochrysis_carterae.AAC.1
MICDVMIDSFSLTPKRLRRMLALPPCFRLSKTSLALAKNNSKLQSFRETWETRTYWLQLALGRVLPDIDHVVTRVYVHLEALKMTLTAYAALILGPAAGMPTAIWLCTTLHVLPVVPGWPELSLLVHQLFNRSFAGS